MMTWHNDDVLMFVTFVFVCVDIFVCLICLFHYIHLCAQSYRLSHSIRLFHSLFAEIKCSCFIVCRPLVDVCVIVEHKALLKRLWFKLDFLKGQDQRFVGVLIVMMTLTHTLLFIYVRSNHVDHHETTALLYSADYILNMTMTESKSVIVMLWSVCWTWIIVIFGLVDAVCCVLHMTNWYC